MVFVRVDGQWFAVSSSLESNKRLLKIYLKTEYGVYDIQTSSRTMSVISLLQIIVFIRYLIHTLSYALLIATLLCNVHRCVFFVAIFHVFTMNEFCNLRQLSSSQTLPLLFAKCMRHNSTSWTLPKISISISSFVSDVQHVFVK